MSDSKNAAEKLALRIIDCINEAPVEVEIVLGVLGGLMHRCLEEVSQPRRAEIVRDLSERLLWGVAERKE